MSLQSDQAFWNTTVQQARGELFGLLAQAYPDEARYRRDGALAGSLLVDWVSPDGQRVFSLNLLEPDEPLALDHFFKTLSSGQRELTLNIREPAKHLALVLECLERFIIHAAPEEELDRKLDALADA